MCGGLYSEVYVCCVESFRMKHAMAWGRNNVKWRLAVNFGWRTYVCMFVWSQKLVGSNESWRYLVA